MLLFICGKYTLIQKDILIIFNDKINSVNSLNSYPITINEQL